MSIHLQTEKGAVRGVGRIGFSGSRRYLFRKDVDEFPQFPEHIATGHADLLRSGKVKDRTTQQYDSLLPL